MNVLTPSGYVDASTLQAGDSVCAFDENTGAPIVNQVETLQYVDLPEWQRWWKPMVDSGELADYPPFAFYKINGTWTLNSEQSIWCNGTNVCHVRDLVVGDTIYDAADNPVVITSVDPVTSAGWYRFDISGDHSYIVDGLTLHNASRFAVNAGAVNWTWDLSTTTHWASASNGAGGQSAPGSADTVTFDGSSGGHVVTPSYGGTGTFQSITCGAFTGTIDWSANNESVTLSSATAFNGSGSGTRTINLGNGTWTLTSTANNTAIWTIATITGLTFNANSSIIDMSGAVSAGLGQTFANNGGLTYGTIKVSGSRLNSGVIWNGGGTIATLNISAAALFSFNAVALTITTLTQAAQLILSVPTGITTTITNAPTLTGTSPAPLAILNSSTGSTATTATISTATGTFGGTWCAISGVTFTGGATFAFTNSLDLGKNTGATITAPSAGGGLITNQGMSGGMA